ARSMMSMQYRTPARLGRPLSVIGQGCWQIGADWDQGETFSGVEYGTGLAAVARLEEALAGKMPLAEASLRWILAQPGATAAIPGAGGGGQARRSAAAGSTRTDAQRAVLERFDAAVHETYDQRLRES